MLPLGTKAIDFNLLDTRGRAVSLTDFEGKPALLVIFMCNHCPYVKHVAPELVRIVGQYQPKGLAVVGISSNDDQAYPDDGPDRMRTEADKQGYTFPYLHDPSQKVAQAYRAACTPDFFLFDAERRLAYRGQLDDSRPKTDRPLTGQDLRHAIDCVLAGQAVDGDQKPSIGCNIKWRPGNEPDYFDPKGIS
jgi:peroxiredoxin